MPEILVISGKGGTGKTSLSAAFAHLAGQSVICDLDVDAPDLHLLLSPKARRTEEFYSGNSAVVDREACTDCGDCLTRCAFGAIHLVDGKPLIDPGSCEGCKVCVTFCPAKAIEFPQRHCGQWFLSETRFGPMAHAQLFPGQENSGRLVALLRQQARELAKEKGIDLILSDGPPGIGCPVISSLSGTDLAVGVTEPTLSGKHDLARLAELCGHFKVPMAVIINKADVNPDEARELANLCEQWGAPVLAELPWDKAFIESMVQKKTITETGGPVAENLARAWRKIREMAVAKKAA